jgi:DNA-binding NarL/FixJ family response regulator
MGGVGILPIRILIADDHPLLRQGIRNFLSLEADFEVIGEAADGEDAVMRAAELRPDVLLLDINMPKANGIEVATRLRELCPEIRIMALTIHDDENYMMKMIQSGAAGYLLKDVDPSMMVQAIRRVYAGESYVEPSLTKKLFRGITSQEPHKATPAPPGTMDNDKLSNREVEVLRLIGKGMSNAEIARNLFLSEKTVKNHLTNIFRKIQVTDRTQAVLFAIKHKIINVE